MIAPQETPRRPTTPRRPLPLWGAALFTIGVFLALRIGGTTPNALTADEVDTIEGGVDLVDHLTEPVPEAPGRIARLKAGFATHAENPRALALPEDQAPRRAVVEAPVPRWLAALGIGVLPASAETTNFARASHAASLAVVLAAGLIAWSRRREGALRALAPAVVFLLLPGVRDGAASAGYAAAGALVMALWDGAFRRTVASGAGAWALGVCYGLALGVHPGAFFLFVALFAAWAIERRSSATLSQVEGQLGLPPTPLALLAAPVLGLFTLIMVWPALWSETGKRVAAWLLDFGTVVGPPQDVAGTIFQPDLGRSAQGWTALLQWVAATPWPFLVLFAVGAWQLARRFGSRPATGARAIPPGAAFALFAWAAILLFGTLDGGLFGARLALLPLLWVPTAIVVAHGLVALVEALRARVSMLSRVAIVLAFLLLPIIEFGIGPAFEPDLATGAEARFPVPIALLDAVASAEPGAQIRFVVRRPKVRGRTSSQTTHDLDVTLDTARDHLELPVHATGAKEQAGWTIMVGDPDAADLVPAASAGAPDAAEIARDDTTGVTLVLYRHGRPAEPGLRSRQSPETRSK